MGGAKKDPNAPKRPLSAYFIFQGMFHCQMCAGNYWTLTSFTSGEKRAEVKAANPDYKIGDIAKVSFLAKSVGWKVLMQEMGKMWQALDEKAKAPYEKKAEAAKKKYAEEMAAYEASWIQFFL